jgi:hypothetical protein
MQADYRRWERRPLSIPVTLASKTGSFQVDDSATTVDVSPRGAKVRTKLSLAPGQLLGVFPQGEFPDAIRTRVVWVNEYELDDWTLAGLEFLNAAKASNAAQAA